MIESSIMKPSCSAWLCLILFVALTGCGGNASEPSGPRDGGEQDSGSAGGGAGSENQADAGRFKCGDTSCPMNEACGTTPCCVSVGCTSHWQCAEITGEVLTLCTGSDGGLKSSCFVGCLP